MPCYHPKKLFVLNNYKNLKVKSKYKYAAYNVVAFFGSKVRTMNDDGLFDFDFRLKPIYRESLSCFADCKEGYCKSGCVRSHLSEREGYDYFYEYIQVPCGKCLGCRLDYSHEWAVRMMMEKEVSDSAWFITLTYSDENITDCEIENPFQFPYSGYYSKKDRCWHGVKQFPNKVYYPDDDGVAKSALSLNKKDLVNFNKRLRKKFPDSDIRFYASGEYGTRTLRPHYHVIYFNVPLDDLVFFKRDSKFVYYISPTIERLWPFGNHLIAHVDFGTCAYVSRYVTKKASGEKAVEKYERFNIMPEFSLMSRNPAIGKRWFDDNYQKVYDSYIITVLDSNGHPVRTKPPRYYDKLYEALDGVSGTSHAKLLASHKANSRTIAQNSTDAKLFNTDFDLLDMLENEEFVFSHNPKNKYHKLSRKEL